MTKEDVKFLLQIRNMPEENLNGLYDNFKQESWSFRAFEQHVLLREYKLCKRAFIFLFYVAESAIGKMVKYLATIDDYAKKHNKKEISFDDCAMRIFTDLKIE